MGNKFQGLKDKLANSSSMNKASDKTKSAAISAKAKFEKLFRRGFSAKQTIAISIILILCLIIVLWPTSKVESPIKSISKIEQSILAGDVKTTVDLIDVDSLAYDISQSVLGQIESKKLTQDLLSYMQKELENKVVADFYNIIENKGDFYKNLDNPNAVLSKTLNFLIDKSGKVINWETTHLEEKEATVVLTVFRPDLDREIKVSLQFFHNDYSWVLFKINNLESLLKTLEDIEQARIDKINAEIKENFNKYIVLKDFQKSELNIKDNSFLLRLSLENISKENITQFEGKLALMDKEQAIGSIDLKIDEVIFANNFYEKAWSIKLHDYESLKSIVKTNSADINAVLEIEKIVFEKGNVLKIIK